MMNTEQETLIEISSHDAAEPTCDWQIIRPVSSVLEHAPQLAGIVDHPEFERLEIVVGTQKITYKRCW